MWYKYNYFRSCKSNFQLFMCDTSQSRSTFCFQSDWLTPSQLLTTRPKTVAAAHVEPDRNRSKERETSTLVGGSLEKKPTFFILDTCNPSFLLKHINLAVTDAVAQACQAVTSQARGACRDMSGLWIPLSAKAAGKSGQGQMLNKTTTISRALLAFTPFGSWPARHRQWVYCYSLVTL